MDLRIAKRKNDDDPPPKKNVRLDSFRLDLNVGQVQISIERPSSLERMEKSRPEGEVFGADGHLAGVSWSVESGGLCKFGQKRWLFNIYSIQYTK